MILYKYILSIYIYYIFFILRLIFLSISFISQTGVEEDRRPRHHSFPEEDDAFHQEHAAREGSDGEAQGNQQAAAPGVRRLFE